jgi:hypothetical protein
VQSYLAGVPTLVLGGRDQGGHLLKVRVVCVCVCVFWGGGGEGAQRGGGSPANVGVEPSGRSFIGTGMTSNSGGQGPGRTPAQGGCGSKKRGTGWGKGGGGLATIRVG